jgi:hypothetical protein
MMKSQDIVNQLISEVKMKDYGDLIANISKVQIIAAANFLINEGYSLDELEDFLESIVREMDVELYTLYSTILNESYERIKKADDVEPSDILN